MKFFSSPWTVALALSSLSCASRLAHVCSDQPRIKESVVPPPGWVNRGPAPKNHVINLNIGLPHSRFDDLERHLYQVSDPFHERYGQHLSKQQVENLVAPHPHRLQAVNVWLACYGIVEADIVRSSAKDWATIKIPVSLAEQMLDTTYFVWNHVESGKSIIRTSQYSLPIQLHEHVDVIQPTTMFGRWSDFKTNVHVDNTPDPQFDHTGSRISASGSDLDPSCNHTITITCLQRLYGTAGYKPSAGPVNQIGITGFLGEFANVADLQLFYANQTPAALGSNFTFIPVNGGLNSQNASEAGVEANLDTQFAFGLTHPTPGVFYSTAGSPPFIPDEFTPTNTNEPYLEWMNFVLSQDSPPQVISTSYGDDEQTVPRSYAKRICQGLAQLGARGVTLLFASGDGGVGDGDGDPATHKCHTNDGHNITQFLPSFPASCPFVTTVGATFRVGPEVAVDFSGGGFSNYFPQPTYQHHAVKQFLSKLPQGLYEGLFNRSGRAYPDISAQGSRFRVFVGGEALSVSGTSASTPAVAAIIALLNDARICSGRPPLGFINPLLYSTGTAGLSDITTGQAPGCGTPGFNATQGWDPVTGLGTPIFPELLRLVM